MPEQLKAVPVRHPGRWVAAVIVLVLLAVLVESALTNPRFEWGTVGHYLLDARVLKGVVLTIELTVSAMVVGVLLGIVVAVMRLSPNPLVASASGFYVWIFRGTPVLVQLYIWYYISAVYPRIGLGVPFGGPDLVHLDANTLIKPFTAALLGLGLNEAAYMAEITRAGIASIDDGQVKAAQALGMTRSETLRRIVMPQAMRVIIPPTANEAIGLLKTSSIASVIAVTELLYSAQLIYSVNYLTIQLLIVASLWYLAITTLLSIAQHRLERRFNRGIAHVAHRA